LHYAGIFLFASYPDELEHNQPLIKNIKGIGGLEIKTDGSVPASAEFASIYSYIFVAP
jgi:hypothetical protein